MKVVVIGAAGQLGRDLCPRLEAEVVRLTRDQVDLARPETLRKTIDDLQPDVVINCAAYNFVDKAETEPEAAFAVNAFGVRELARICRDGNYVLVHFSTDYVFGLDENRQQPYMESDAPGPVGAYGLGKLAGEYFARSLCPKHFVIRTCGLYGVWGSGGKGGNFVETMLRLANQAKPMRVVSDQTCTPTYTVDLANAVIPLLSTHYFGVYHLTNSGSCSWHEFARTIFEKAGLSANLSPITTKEYGAPARRPGYSVLAAKAYASLGLPALRPWPEALAAYLIERTEKPAH